MAEHDCGHRCCDERSDPLHDHFLGPDVCCSVGPDERWAGESVSRFDALEVWQRRCGEWTNSRFPEDDLRSRGLVLGEETGEVLRCIVKAAQGIRGGEERWLAELPSEVADVFFCLAAIAHRAGFDLGRAIEDRWDVLRKRTRAGEVARAD